MKAFVKRLWRKIFGPRKLTPVVALNEQSQIIYGRFDSYVDWQDDAEWWVWNSRTGEHEATFKPKVISEELLLQHMRLQAGK